METDANSKRLSRRLVAEVDPDTMRRLRIFQADHDKSIREIIEAALHRHFKAVEQETIPCQND